MSYFTFEKLAVNSVEGQVINVDVTVKERDMPFNLNIFKNEIKSFTHTRAAKKLEVWFNSEPGKEWVTLNRLKKII